jgi:hypothetical protein
MKLTRYFFSLAALALLTAFLSQAIAESSIPAGSVRIHYHRNNADYEGWTVYDWTGAKNPSPSWQNPGTPPFVSDDFGVYWDIALADGATQLFFIVRNADGNVKTRAGTPAPQFDFPELPGQPSNLPCRSSMMMSRYVLPDGIIGITCSV